MMAESALLRRPSARNPALSSPLLGAKWVFRTAHGPLPRGLFLPTLGPPGVALHRLARRATSPLSPFPLQEMTPPDTG